jgi:fatty-acyl-CoA synthase
MRATAPISTPDDIIAIEAAGLAAFQPHAHLLQALEATAAVHGPRPAISWLADAEGPAETWSHAELLQRVRQAANLFRALGADDEHGIAFLLPAIPAAWLALLGGEVAGRVCPINYLLDAEHIAALIDASGARVLVALAPCAELDIAAKAERVRALCPGLRAVLWAAADDHGFEAQLARQPGDHLTFDRAVGRDSIAATFHTGGTTGAPKLAMHTHGNQLHVARGAALAYALDQHDTVINAFPLFHVAGAFVYGLSTLLAGGQLLLPTLLGMRNPALVRRYWQLVDQERVTVLAAVPTVMSALLNLDPGDADLSAVRVLYTGGSPLPDELAAGFERRFGIPVRNILGMTECAGVIGIEPFHAPRVPGSCGLRLPFTEVCAVADAPGPVTPLPAGETGILALRGPNVGPGYTDAARNAGSFEGGWLVTGDIGHVAADGRIFITGRAKDLIIRSGHNIDPGVIEDALLRHAGVLMAAAVGEPDEYAGELPVAFVVARPGAVLDVAALLQAAAAHVPERPAAPKRITVVDALPLTAIGKVYKPALRALAIEAAIGERLQRAGLGERVTLTSEMRPRGPALVFTRRGADDDAAIAALMAPFALPWRVQDGA